MLPEELADLAGNLLAMAANEMGKMCGIILAVGIDIGLRQGLNPSEAVKMGEAMIVEFLTMSEETDSPESMSWVDDVYAYLNQEIMGVK